MKQPQVKQEKSSPLRVGSQERKQCAHPSIATSKAPRSERKWWPLVIIGIFSGIVGGIAGYYGWPSLLDLSLTEIAYIVLCLCFATYLQVFIHEGGHYLFGKLTGYKFISFRIGKVMFLYQGGRLETKRFNLVGTSGQCLMMPPESDDNHFPYVLYNLGGCLANLIFALLSLLLYLLFSPSWLTAVFLLANFNLGILYALLNGIPLRVQGIANDGYNVMRLAKNTEARRAFWLQLQISALRTSGVRLRDMPPEWFVLPQPAALYDPLVCATGVFCCSYYHDKKEFDQARQASEFMLSHAPSLPAVHKNELLCELLFYEILGACRQEEIQCLYTPALQKYIQATANYDVSRQRLLYAYDLLVNQAEESAQRRLVAFEKVAKAYPYPTEIESERELLALIRETAERRKQQGMTANLASLPSDI